MTIWGSSDGSARASRAALTPYRAAGSERAPRDKPKKKAVTPEGAEASAGSLPDSSESAREALSSSEPFLAPCLAVEALRAAGLAWAVYARRSEHVLLRIAAYGELPPEGELSEALDSIQRFDAPGAQEPRPGIRIAAIDQAHALLFSDEPLVPSLSSAVIKASALAGEPLRTLSQSIAPAYTVSVPEAILEAAAGYGATAIALFALDLSGLISKALSVCPCVDAEALCDELCSIVSSILHLTGSAYRLRRSCLCAVFSRSACDEELAAAQLAQTLAARFGIAAADGSSLVIGSAAMQAKPEALEGMRARIDAWS